MRIKLSGLRILPFMAFLFTFSSFLSAAETGDRWSQAREEELRAKQAKIDEMRTKIDALTRQIEDERKTASASHEKIWKEYKEGLEAERKGLQDQMKALDDREQLFEAELEKRRRQDETREREKEDQVQGLMSQVDFLSKQMAEDRKNFETEMHAIHEANRKNIRHGRDISLAGEGERLANGGMQMVQRREGGAPVSGGAVSMLKAARSEYYLEIGDVIGIDVWRVPDLSRDVTVRPDGRISLPIVGDVDVVGMTLIQLRDVLSKKFSDYVWNPQVSIAIRQFGGRKIVILGEIRSPGVYRFQQDISLIEGIALAGGFNPNAKRGRVMIIRGDIRKDPQVKIINANMENVLKKGMLSENLTLAPNDIIYVTKDFLGDYREVIENLISPTLGTATDFMVFRSAIRTAQDKRN